MTIAAVEEIKALRSRLAELERIARAPRDAAIARSLDDLPPAGRRLVLALIDAARREAAHEAQSQSPSEERRRIPPGARSSRRPSSPRMKGAGGRARPGTFRPAWGGPP